MGEKRHTVTIQQNRGSPIVVSKSDIAVQGQSDARPQESIQIISGKCNLKQIKQIEECLWKWAICEMNLERQNHKKRQNGEFCS